MQERASHQANYDEMADKQTEDNQRKTIETQQEQIVVLLKLARSSQAAQAAAEKKSSVKQRELHDNQEELTLTAKRMKRDNDAPKDKKSVIIQLDLLEDASRILKRAQQRIEDSKVLALAEGAAAENLKREDLVEDSFAKGEDGKASVPIKQFGALSRQ